MLPTSALAAWTLLLTPLVYVIYHVTIYLLGARRRVKAAGQFPGDPRAWLSGHLYLFPTPHNGEEALSFWRECTKKYPKVQQFFFGPSILDQSIHVRHPESIKPILQSSEPKPIGQGSYGFGLPWLGDGLLLSQGKKWSRNRRLLTPAFHFDILKPYMKINNHCADLLLDKIATSAAKGESFEFFGNISLYTFDVILRCAMSYETDIQTKGEDHPYVNSVNRLGDLWVDRVFIPWQHIGFLYRMTADGREFQRHCDYVHTVSEEVIRTRQKDMAAGQAGETRAGKRCLDFLDILLKARDGDGEGLTFDEIRAEVDTFMFEGHDTTASAVSWTLYSLAQHPEIAARCQQEIDHVMEGRSDDQVTWDDLPKLKYLTQCIKEGMRLHCPVPFITRELTKDMTIDGKVLTKGCAVTIQVYNLHHNSAVWGDTMKYDPSRFDPDNVEKMDSFAFVPFSAGPRNCIGQNFAMHEMKTVIARILRRFNLAVDPHHQVAKKIGVVMKSMNGIKLRVTPRD